ncbi:MAG TPA: S41 family peptidase [Stellaceae bacterium]|nr:S41 family peptidase [Stellaceae bacterium]
MRKWVPTLVLLALLAPHAALPQSKPAKSGVYEQLNLFGEAFERIRQDAVEPVGDRRLIETAISGMLASLDPNSVYLNEDEYKTQQNAAETQPGSIGLVVTIDAGQLKVVSPRDNSPAANAGIKPGEPIFAIDKEPVFDLTLSEVEAKLQGPVDSSVTLTLRRDANGKPIDVPIKRVAAKWPTVTSRLEGADVGYIRLAGFDSGTQAALTGAIQDLTQRAGSKLIGLVLDLRNSPGGDFDVAVQVADDFLDKGDIAIVKGRKGDSRHVAATPGDITNGLPVVALVNGGTANEAELVAGALQDNHRGVLVGTKTFGQSGITTVIPLNGNGAIRLTTARFLTPSGRTIQGKGLDPDVVVAPVKLERIAQGFGRREADLRGALKNTDPVAAPAANPPATSEAPKPNKPAAPTAGATPPAEKHDTRSSVATGELGGSEDEQLTQALDMLRGLKLVSATRNGQ